MKNSLLLFLILCAIACRKEPATNDAAARLYFSEDSLSFDTVFTTLPAITKQFKIFNSNPQPVHINELRLSNASSFFINVNGQKGPVINNLTIPAGDSAYLFVSLYVAETTSPTAFQVLDSIEVVYNDQKKVVQLSAVAQNANILRDHNIASNAVWIAGKPYVLLGNCTVKENASLTIEAGTKLYAHGNAALIIEGSLHVNANAENKVMFQGDRFDAPYRDVPGSWQGIVFKASHAESRITHAVIKNAVRGIVMESSANKLFLQETIIDNASDAGLLATNARLDAQNILISNCSRGMVLRNGGQYTIAHATLAAYNTPLQAHRFPLLSFEKENAATNLQVLFRNGIIWSESGGAVADEVVMQGPFSANDTIVFDGVLWPMAVPPAFTQVTVPPIMADPQFLLTDSERNTFDFRLQESAPARGAGQPSGVSLDLDGRPRPVAKADLGAYQYQ